MSTYRPAMMIICPTRLACLASLAFCIAVLPSAAEAAPPREPSLNARIASCDVATSHSAVGELLRAPETLREPILLFDAALSERMAGRNEDAAFLFLAARLRTSRQILTQKGDRPQLLGVMVMTVGPLIMPVLEADPELARRVVRRTIDWDRSTPDPFRDRPDAASGDNAKKIAEIDDGLRRLPDQILANTSRAAQAREGIEDAERQLKAMRAERCGPGATKPVAAEPARGPDQTSPASSLPASICGFHGLSLPADFAVFAAGAYSGRKTSRQIDQSGHQATQIDVAVNNPDKPSVLILGAYEPTIWNIGVSNETRILAVLVAGYHRQVVAGLDKSIPLLVSSGHEKAPCGRFYVTADNLTELNLLSRRVFGRPVDMVYPASKGRAEVGKPLPPDATLDRSMGIAPEAFYDKHAPLAGAAGLEDAVRKGLLRKATEADADAWTEAVIQNSPQRDIPPVAGQDIRQRNKPRIDKGYVVLRPFVYPAGLAGAHSARFFIARGVPRPGGKPGHSTVYDFNTLQCHGPGCNAR